jgi:hypothetical protein
MGCGGKAAFARRASLRAALLLAVVVAGCGTRALQPAPQVTADGAVADVAAARDVVAARDLLPGFADLIPVDAAAAQDGGSCMLYPREQYEVACFGDEFASYQKYLRPRDGGGFPVGQCPRPDQFGNISEAECGWLPCGPLTADGIAGLADAGVPRGDDGGAAVCCFLVRYVCGV